MAADTKKITIEIIGKGSEKDGEKDGEKKQKSGKKNKKSDGQIWLSMVAQRAKEIVISTIETDASRYFYMKEDYLGETLYRNIKNNVGKAIGAASTIAAGAKVGGGVGAAIAAVGVAVNEGFSIYNKYATLENQMNTLNYGMEFSRTRAGLVDNGRGTEN